MSAIGEIEKCPMCGGKAITFNVDDYNIRKYRTVCKECGTSTRICVSVNESLRVWNQRIQADDKPPAWDYPLWHSRQQ